MEEGPLTLVFCCVIVIIVVIIMVKFNIIENNLEQNKEKALVGAQLSSTLLLANI